MNDSTMVVARILAAGGAGLAVWLLLLAVTRLTTRRRLGRMRSLMVDVPQDRPDKIPDSEAIRAQQIASRRFYQRTLLPLWQRVTPLMAKYAPTRITVTLQRQLDGAGNPGKMGPYELLVAKVIGLLLGIPVGFFLIPLLLGRNDAAHTLVYVVLVAVGCCFLPDLWLRQKRRAYLYGISRALPDVVDLLRVSMDGGLSFDGSVGYVVTHMKNALTTEMNRYLVERQIGRRQDEAMHLMANRTREPDLVRFVEVVVQGEALGTGINRALTAFSDDLRTKRRQRAEKKAHEASMKMLFPMVGLIFPAIFIIILGPTVPIFISSFGLH